MTSVHAPATRPVKVDAIHVGDYKTGSSWLQQEVLLRHPSILYLDWPTTHPAIAKLLYELICTRDLDFNAASLAGRLNAELAKLDCAGRKLVISREALVGDFISGEHARRISERLFQVFGPTRIILVIREQFSMMASIYSQHVKIGGTLSLHDFVHDPIVSSHLADRLQYDRLIQLYIETFGAENVSVKLFEEFQADKKRFLREVLAHIGCEDTDFSPEGQSANNRSLTTAGAVLQRVLNRLVRTHTNPGKSLLPVDKLVAALLSERQKRRLLDSAQVQFPWVDVERNPQHYLLYSINMALNLEISGLCELVRVGGKIVVPESLRAPFREAFARSNRVLASRYGLPVSGHGWTL